MRRYSLVLISHNHKNFLERSLTSISRQSLNPTQIILVDVASGDGSGELLQNWADEYGSRAKFLSLPKQQSIVEVLQKVEPLVSEPLVSFISADDFFSEDRFQIQVEALSNAAPSVVVCFTDAVAVDHHGQRLRAMRSYPQITVPITIDSHQIRNLLLRGNRVIAPTVMMKTEKIRRRIAELDPEMPLEDYPLWLSLSECYDFLYLPLPLVSYRLHDGNVSRKSRVKRRFSQVELALLSSILVAEPERASHIRRGALKLLWRSIKLRDSWAVLKALSLLKQSC